MYYDTHAHLDYYLPESKSTNNALDEDDLQVMQKINNSCLQKNVKFLNTISVEIDKFERIYKITESFENIFCSIGQHPLYVLNADLNDLIAKMNFFLEKDSQNSKINGQKKIIAIGECGLDFFKIEQVLKKEKQIISEESFKKTQINFLEHQIEIAKKFDLPCVVHIREGEDIIYDIFKNSRHNKGVLHSFTGGKDFMKKMLDLDFFVSFSGIVTFKNATNVQEALKYCPIDKILIETDSPYLSPEPIRGVRNLPENVTHVFDFVGNFLINNNSILSKNENLESLKIQIFNNSVKCFKIQSTNI